MYDYRIEKQRLGVTVLLASGDVVRGHVFVQPSVYGMHAHAGPHGRRGQLAPRTYLLNQAMVRFPAKSAAALL